MPRKVSTFRETGKRKKKTKNIATGSYYALLIGITDYQHLIDLEYPLKDATEMKSILLSQYSFPEDHVFLLENPSRASILEALDEIDVLLEENDSLLIFYAGHGHWEEDREQGYWLPADAKLRRRSAWISNATLQEYLRGFDCKHTLIISDSCFSGTLLTRSIEEASIDIQTLYGTKSRQALTSGVKEEVPDRSVFFKYLGATLRKNQEPFLTTTKLYSQIRDKIIEYSPRHQNPQFGVIGDADDRGGDFIFILKGVSPMTLSRETDSFQLLLEDERVRERLTALRAQLDQTIPSKEDTDNLLIASWNIRKLGGYDYGGRLPESLGYIAEIISRFHIVAVQEIYGNLQILDDLKSYLGKHWDFTFSDTSVGYGYRLGYFFDRRKVSQRGPTNDLILPHKRIRDKKGRFRYEPVEQLLRPPFHCGFQIDDTRLLLCNVHSVFSGREKQQRLKDLENVLNYWQQRLSQKNNWTKNIVLLGNFQTTKMTDKEIRIIKDRQFLIPEEVQLATNIKQNRYYNQMVFSPPTIATMQVQQGGTVDFFESVFRKQDREVYLPFYETYKNQATHLKSPSSKAIFYSKFWRISQLSDNLPLWAEVKMMV